MNADDINAMARGFKQLPGFAVDQSQLARFDDLVKSHARRIAARNEAIARQAVRQSVRHRLRWAAEKPAALRALTAIGLWHPPTLQYVHGDPVVRRVARR